MFPIDSLPAQYFEERQAAEAARRSQEQQGKAQTTATTCQAQSQSQQQHRAFLQRPQLSRPASSTVLGNIFQGFVRNGQSPPPGTRGTASGTSTPATTPPAKITTQAELEVLMAEKKRDADYIGSSPGWW